MKDINPGASGSRMKEMVEFDGMLYFRASDGAHGDELWKSDGTEAGTVMVKDIYPGTTSGSPEELTVANDILFFQARDNNNLYYELWKTDGTEVGTVMVKDINVGWSSYPSDLINVGGTLYFAADDGLNGEELWTSDGTTEGTVLVNDIHLLDGGSVPGWLTRVNDLLYFSADDGIYGSELWLLNTSDDTDGDGMSDEWEQANGLNPDDPSDKWEDLDGDTIPNFAEWRLGTEPDVADETECPGDDVIIIGVTYPFGYLGGCVASSSIRAGFPEYPVIVEDGAEVTYEAITVELLPGFRVECCGVFRVIISPD